MFSLFDIFSLSCSEFRMLYKNKALSMYSVHCTPSFIHKTFFFIIASFLFSIRKTKIDKYCVKSIYTKFSSTGNWTGLSAFVNTYIAHQWCQCKMWKNEKQGHFIFGNDVIANFIGPILYLRLQLNCLSSHLDHQMSHLYSHE